jgi:hypothetical protein
MKKILLIVLSIIPFIIQAQDNFKWEKVDSIQKSKNQIYSDTKVFIAKKWKSAKDVIQNDDKEAGIIQIKGAYIKQVSFYMGEYEYIYSYLITFKMKDNKYKIVLDNVYCASARMLTGSGRVVKIEPFDGDNCPETGTFSAPGISKKKAIQMMAEVKSELQKIISSYEQEIKQPSASEEW